MFTLGDNDTHIDDTLNRAYTKYNYICEIAIGLCNDFSRNDNGSYWSLVI